jgi:iron complex transport system ATP-binding protein
VEKSTLHLRRLTLGYRYRNKEQVVARDLSATLRNGELTCLIGANGTGKSTLLRTLAGFQPALSGEIQLDGQDLRTYSANALAKRIGVVLTDRPEISHLSVFELAGLGRSPYTGFWGALTEYDKAVVTEALQQTGIAHRATQPVDQLSDGEKQKVLIAKALAQQTPLIFLDEPTAFLDFPSKVEILQTLRHLSRTLGKTVLLTTHDLELAFQIADHLWLLDPQRGLTTGAPAALAQSGDLSTLFPGKHIRFDAPTGRFQIQ